MLALLLKAMPGIVRFGLPLSHDATRLKAPYWHEHWSEAGKNKQTVPSNVWLSLKPIDLQRPIKCAMIGFKTPARRFHAFLNLWL